MCYVEVLAIIYIKVLTLIIYYIRNVCKHVIFGVFHCKQSASTGDAIRLQFHFLPQTQQVNLHGATMAFCMYISSIIRSLRMGDIVEVVYITYSVAMSTVMMVKGVLMPATAMFALHFNLPPIQQNHLTS